MQMQVPHRYEGRQDQDVGLQWSHTTHTHTHTHRISQVMVHTGRDLEALHSMLKLYAFIIVLVIRFNSAGVRPQLHFQRFQGMLASHLTTLLPLVHSIPASLLATLFPQVHSTPASLLITIPVIVRSTLASSLTTPLPRIHSTLATLLATTLIWVHNTLVNLRTSPGVHSHDAQANLTMALCNLVCVVFLKTHHVMTSQHVLREENPTTQPYLLPLTSQTITLMKIAPLTHKHGHSQCILLVYITV